MRHGDSPGRSRVQHGHFTVIPPCAPFFPRPSRVHHSCPGPVVYAIWPYTRAYLHPLYVPVCTSAALALLGCRWLSVSKGMACSFAGVGCSLFLLWSIAGLWVVPLWFWWCWFAVDARVVLQRCFGYMVVLTDCVDWIVWFASEASGWWWS
jgi:hypothetical protein